MLYSQLFGKTQKFDFKENVSINAELLQRAGFIDQLMSGSYTLLPLGIKVVKKIEQIIREEMNKTEAQEVLMPLLHPKNIWNETGRWESAREVMFQFKKDEKEYALSFTHEEIVLDLIRKHSFTYRDYPIKIYHFSTKFRNELRPKSGILRGREFLMKDLYSAHTTKEDLDKYYWQVADNYQVVFKRTGINTRIVEASGGVFTKENTHEFQLFCSGGEDTIYYCEKCEFAQNKEIATVKEGNTCPKCKGKILMTKSIEVGNIFRFGTVYSQKMNVKFVDNNGQRQCPYFGSYGIGLTRLMGAVVEVHHDQKGIVWPESVAPYKYHLIALDMKDEKIKKRAKEIYSLLTTHYKLGVLFDDREDVAAGEKFADADLIGIPTRLVISKRTGDKVEVKKRSGNKVELKTLDDAVNDIH